MKTIIAGSRNVSDIKIVQAALWNARSAGILITEVVSGGCRGVDGLGERLAREHGFPITVFGADWDTHGRAAGPIRNTKMADYADALIAVWDGKSRGTFDMISKARKRKLLVYIERIGFVDQTKKT